MNEETIADIVAELRHDAITLTDDDAHAETCWTNYDAATIYECLADRIEAAAKRMQENIDAFRERIYVLESKTKRKPRRNCDRFKTAKEAEAGFDAFCAADRNGKCNPRDCSLPRWSGAKSCFSAWLYAPAEGGKE